LMLSGSFQVPAWRVELLKVGSKNSFFLTFRQIADGGFEKIIEPINDFFKIEEKLQKVFQYCI